MILDWLIQLRPHNTYYIQSSCLSFYFIQLLFAFFLDKLDVWIKLISIIVHFNFNSFFQTLYRCNRFICFVIQDKVRWKFLSLTELPEQGDMSTGVVSLGCESDSSQESDSVGRFTTGNTGPFWKDRQETVNLEEREPEFCVFTSQVLQVMSSRYKKIQSSEAQSFCYCLRG